MHGTAHPASQLGALTFAPQLCRGFTVLLSVMAAGGCQVMRPGWQCASPVLQTGAHITGQEKHYKDSILD